MSTPFSFTIDTFESIADTITPVSIYLKLRDLYPASLLLESSDYRGDENSISYICADPVSVFSLDGEHILSKLPGHSPELKLLKNKQGLIAELDAHRDKIKAMASKEALPHVGLFGYSGFSAIPYIEKITFDNPVPEPEKIPHAVYSLYRYVIRFDHFSNTVKVITIRHNADNALSSEQFFKLIKPSASIQYPFGITGEEESNFSDQSFENVIVKMKQHIARGDVFQIVPSRKFSQKFTGDDFNVYRALRCINPSPYLFYFDYGAYKIFGSSPEAHLQVKDGVAEIHPIAGTYKRTGIAESDKTLADKLLNDPKENAEHVMLVDLARNDLSKHCRSVQVASYKEVQFYSHVIHLVSKVTGTLNKKEELVTLLLDSLPAGTLSGAPKYRALELINEYEGAGRGFYGGGLGYLGLECDCVHAIMIRTFLSKGNTLFYQAGAGVVASSVPASEVAEVANKITALRKAVIKGAELLI
jgi:anthranilate synthase component 1